MTAGERAVVVGNDGSEQGFGAVRWAADEALRLSTSLHVVHAWMWPLFRVDLGPAPGAPAGAGLRAQAEAVLADSTSQAHEVAPTLAVTTSLLTGAAAPLLIREAAAAWMLVVGNRGLGGFTGLLVGSVGVEVSAHAVCPVV